jgi:hypothetical protein
MKVPEFDTAAIMGGLYGDRIIGYKNAFTREWVQCLHEEVLALYVNALNQQGGTVGRHYFEIHPENISGLLI